MLTITEMKRLNKEAGQHWFSEGAMKFFNTKIEAKPNKNNLFITSECPDGGVRRYTIRRFNPETYEVETASEFWEFETLEEAKAARKQMK